MNDHRDDTASGDDQFTTFQRANLKRAADHFGVTVTGEAHLGWRLRSISAPVHSAHHGACWLKVTSEFPEYAHGDTWTGTSDAEALNDVVTKPRLIDTTQWEDKESWRVQRAELTTVIDDKPCSPHEQPSSDLALPDSWWQDLTTSLDRLTAQPTTRQRVTTDDIAHRLTIFFGDRAEAHVDTWSTAHGDLHWANLTTPRLAILDWELWGRAPAGYDAATLLCFSLNNPPLAQEIKNRFATVLNTPSGKVAQLDVITRLLLRANDGDNPDLAIPLHHHAQKLIDTHT